MCNIYEILQTISNAIASTKKEEEVRTESCVEKKIFSKELIIVYQMNGALDHQT
jgi:hypothetical protein